MEKQDNRNFNKKDNEPRISVRPGNFIVPGGQGKPAEGAPAEKKNEQGARQSGNGHGYGRNRHGRGRNGKHRREDLPQQNQQGAKAPEVGNVPKQKSQGGEHKGTPPVQHGKHKHRNDRRGGNQRPEQAANAPVQKENTRPVQGAFSQKSQREEKSPFFDLDIISPLSPNHPAAKKAEELSAVDTKEFEVDIATAAYLLDDIPCGFPAPDGKSVEVVGVRFRRAGKVYFFSPEGEKFKIGEPAIVDTARGPEFGEIVLLNRKMAQKDIVQPLRPVLRRATPEDIAHNKENRKKEADAMKVCAEKITAHGLEMHLIDAQYAFDNSKLLFYFTSEGRVDFRELVRDLAGVFRTRIELRQVGIRDESRLIGGLGMCGRPFCCTTFLSDFGQVSVKMAKEQGLSINTSKISGCCDRLMCCLRYENESYAAEAALTPKKDTRVNTPEGVGTVVDATPLSGMLKVRLDKAPEEAPIVLHRDKVTPLAAKTEAEPAGEQAEK